MKIVLAAIAAAAFAALFSSPAAAENIACCTVATATPVPSQTSRNVATADLNGNLYIAYTTPDNNRTLYIGNVTISNGAWHQRATPAASDISPSLAVYNNRLYVAWQQVNSPVFPMCIAQVQMDGFGNPTGLTDVSEFDNYVPYTSPMLAGGPDGLFVVLTTAGPPGTINYARVTVQENNRPSNGCGGGSAVSAH
jgi:hypothetical protein